MTTTQKMPDIIGGNVFIRGGNVVFQKNDYPSAKPRSLDIIERIGGDIRLGSLEYFFNHVLPPMKPGLDVDRIYNSCIRGKILSKKRGSKEYTWKSIRKNARATPAHKTRFVNLFRSVTRMAQRNTSVNTGMTSTHFDILDNGPEVKSGRDRNDDQDSVIYLENTLQSLPDTSEEERLCNTSFSFHFKSSNLNNDAYDVRFILNPCTNTDILRL